MIRGISLAVCILALTSVVSAGTWSYTGKTGPHYWHEIFPEACGGKNQSPIDIKSEETLFDPDLKDFAIWYDPPRPDSKMYIKNTGYTVQVDLKGDFFLSNGGLGHVFKAAQFHFHWGHKAHHGSEHTMEGKPNPIELHVVTYNHDIYSDIREAVTQPGGLAVLGVLFELAEEDNPSFEYIIRGMAHIRNPDKLPKVELPLFSIRDLLPHDISRYYRYNGSLTTPGCFESVMWTVFEQPQTISYKQMEEFRKMLKFKRKHHLHHHGDDKETNRQKRGLSSAEKEKEKNAKQVLDELGINSKDSGLEREALKEQLVKVKTQGVEPANSDATNMVDPVEATKMKYIQDNIVNNYRPIQALNDRIVYRSFKLRENYALEVDHQQMGYTSKGENGANGLSVSMTTAVIISFFTIVYRLLH